MKNSFYSKITEPLHKKLNHHLLSAHQWFYKTPERALEEAYQAALIIKSLEEEYFNGKRICTDSTDYSENVLSYLETDLGKNLSKVRMRLAEFKVSRYFLNVSNPLLLEKVKLIDSIIEKYSYPSNNSLALVPIANSVKLDSYKKNQSVSSMNMEDLTTETVSDKTGVLPRSIGRTINKIKSELDPKAEEEVIKKFRNSRNKTRISVRFLVILITVPLLVQITAKNFLVTPLVNNFVSQNEAQIFLNSEMKEEALRELQSFEEELKFNNLINPTNPLSAEVMEEQVKHKANEIAEEFRGKSRDAVGNVFADIIALVAFALVIVTHKQDIVVLKSFMDEIVYGLSDSAKAFIIILFTDIFVGFHSPHGWEVLLESLAGHLGIAANKSAISLFIATVPVILDTIFKYWIFRYLSRISPSAVATLRNMNE
ncbi:proton extrusion protein PcxA [Aerosakkonemataceae cyanobacterium BLCC-F50]|uniref:Proton extrusion protein PxcA n=1 Tax=Floridaenema flaviceps BLCC-F50 TaxID=3153642 RepID=A0ABV4XSH0_9CYAN